MKILRTGVCLLGLTLLSACGYHATPVKNPKLGDAKTFSVDVFENSSFYPLAAMQMTNALADAMQSDGTFQMVSHGAEDISISGRIVSVDSSSLRTNPLDTYVSDEVRLTVRVAYKVTETRTGKVLMSGTVAESANSPNHVGNVQSSRDDAVSWAVRQVADHIVSLLTTA